MLGRACRRIYRLTVIIIRPCNNYGPWKYPEKFIPLTIAKAMEHEKIPVYGEGLNVREWISVTDCAGAIFIRILVDGNIGEVYNL
jgi:dTDP-glucose 4,6-dehydratase